MSSERALTTTCVVDEVRVVLRHGSRLLRIHDFYEYEVRQYEPKTDEGHFV